MKFEAVLSDHWPYIAGEILVVPDYGAREPFGGERKTSKSDVETECFDEASAAVGYVRLLGLDPIIPDGYPRTVEAAKAALALARAVSS